MYQRLVSAVSGSWTLKSLVLQKLPYRRPQHVRPRVLRQVFGQALALVLGVGFITLQVCSSCTPQACERTLP